VRLGFVVADPPLIAELRALRRFMYRHPPLNNQRAMALFLSMGYGDDHARRNREVLARKWRTITAAVQHHMPDCRFSGTSGGSSLWMQAPSGTDTWMLQRLAARRGVLIEPGDIHFLGADRPSEYFRLGFGAIAEAQIEPGIALLGQVFRDMPR